MADEICLAAFIYLFPPPTSFFPPTKQKRMRKYSAQLSPGRLPTRAGKMQMAGNTARCPRAWEPATAHGGGALGTRRPRDKKKNSPQTRAPVAMLGWGRHPTEGEADASQRGDKTSPNPTLKARKILVDLFFFLPHPWPPAGESVGVALLVRLVWSEGGH